MGKRWALPSVLIVGGCWLELDGAPLTELVYGQVVEVGVEQRILRASSKAILWLVGVWVVRLPPSVCCT
jgi:hypothetical protein